MFQILHQPAAMKGFDETAETAHYSKGAIKLMP